MFVWLRGYHLIDEIKLGSAIKKALCDVHSGGKHSKRDLATLCWLSAYSDFGCIGCDQAPHNNISPMANPQGTVRLLLEFCGKREEVNHGFVDECHGATGRRVFAVWD